jgi:hypothetical protein
MFLKISGRLELGGAGLVRNWKEKQWRQSWGILHRAIPAALNTKCVNTKVPSPATASARS